MKFLNHELIRISLIEEEADNFRVQIDGPTYPELFYDLGMETYRTLIRDLELNENDIEEFSDVYKDHNFIIEILHHDDGNANVIFYTDETFDDKDVEGKVLLMEEGSRPMITLNYEDMLIFANTMFRIVALAAQIEANERNVS